MATDINLSLDDIIKKNKTKGSAATGRRRNVGNRNNQNGRRLMNGKKNGGGGGVGKNFNGGGRFRNNIIGRPRPAARFSPYKRVSILTHQPKVTIELSTWAKYVSNRGLVDAAASAF